MILLKENQELIKSLNRNFQIISIQKNDNSDDNENGGLWIKVRKLKDNSIVK